MKSEFALAINEILEKSGLSREMVIEAVEASMVSAYRRDVNASNAQNISAYIDLTEGSIQILSEKEIVEEVENPLTETSLEVGRQTDPEVNIGDIIMVDSTPKGYGRVAAQTAKQVILQRLREAERDAQYKEYIEREGDMVHGTVHSVTYQAVTIGLGKAEALLPRNQMIPGERFRVRDRVRVYVLEVRKSSRGPVIIVSRTHPNMLRRLLEMEVPEISQGLVEIKAIAREAGKRAKVAVSALRDGVDPVGACVGLRGVRIQSIVRDLNDEKIDVIEWNPDTATFIAKALSPARVSGVYLDENPNRGKTAVVVVPEDQLSLAIGRSGVNARLAARLTGWRIDIKSLPEAAIESLRLLETDPIFVGQADQDQEKVEQIQVILDKKAENRPATPEEYRILTAFVDQIQSRVEIERSARRQREKEKRAEVRAVIPAVAFTEDLETLGLSKRVFGLLNDAGYKTVGRIWEELLINEDAILGLSGFGPKALGDLYKTLEVRKAVAQKAAEEAEKEAAAAKAEMEKKALELSEEGLAEEVATEQIAKEAKPGPEGEVEVELEKKPLAEGIEPTEQAVEVELQAEEIEPAALSPDTEAIELAVEVAAASEYEVAGGDEEKILEIESDQKDKKQKKRRRVIQLDPESGKTFIKHKRKRSRQDGEWEEGDVYD